MRSDKSLFEQRHGSGGAPTPLCSAVMTLAPGTKIGLVPIVMGCAVPTATLWAVRRLGIGPR